MDDKVVARWGWMWAYLLVGGLLVGLIFADLLEDKGQWFDILAGLLGTAYVYMGAREWERVGQHD